MEPRPASSLMEPRPTSSMMEPRPASSLMEPRYEHSDYQYTVAREDHHEQASFDNIEDMLFEVFRCENIDVIKSDTNNIAVGQFIMALESTGLRRYDPRLKEMLAKLQGFTGEETLSGEILDKQYIGRKDFKNLIIENIVLITRALRHQLIIPDFKSFTQQVDQVFREARSVEAGSPAQYIGQLAKEDPDQFGMSLCTVDGQRYSLEDASTNFTLQSVCKPLIYAIILNELGREVVHSYMGQEPSGRKFNDMELDDNKKPHNPIVNAGAIVTISLLQKLIQPHMSMADKFDYITNYLSRMAGGEHIGFNNSVFLAEKEHSDRNFALAYYMKENNCFPPGTNVTDVLDLWFQCCSLEVNCETVAVIGATLANGGVCPITGDQVLQSEAVRDVLSLLHSCGFYEYSGAFAFKVGIPGKSSVAGSMMMVLPNTMSICLWSPPVDQYGNSCRGLAFMQSLTKNFSFHRYEGRNMISKSNPRRAITESRGDTIVSLLFAAAAGDLSELRRHKFLGHDMGVSDYDGRTPLHLAAAEGHADSVKFLLTLCDVHPEPTDRWGFTPLSEAERSGHSDVVALLQVWTAREGDNHTLTAQDGEKLLYKINKAQALHTGRSMD